MLRVASRSLIGDVAVVGGFGLLGGLLAVGLPFYIPVALLGALAALAVVNRIGDIEGVANGFLVAAAFVQPWSRIGFGPLEVGDYLLILSFGAFTVIRLQGSAPSGNRAGSFRPMLLGGILMIAGGLVGAFYAPNKPFIYSVGGRQGPLDHSGFGENITNLMALAFGVMMPLLVFAIARPRRRMLINLGKAFIMGAAISVPVGIFGEGIAWLNFPLDLDRAVGLAPHPIQFGQICVFALGLLAAIALSENRLPVWLAGSAVVLVYGVYISGSRGPFGALLILCVLVGPVSRRRSIMAAMLTVAAAGLLLLGLGLVQASGENAVSRSLGATESAEMSNEARDVLHSRVWDYLVDHPLTGVGYTYMRPAHNIYLGIAACAGVLGVVGFGRILWTLGRRVWRVRHDPLVTCVAIAYFSYLVAGWFDNSFWWRWLWFYVGLLVCLCDAADLERDQAEAGLASGRSSADGDADSPDAPPLVTV